jgi:hypothetical protein
MACEEALPPMLAPVSAANRFLQMHDLQDTRIEAYARLAYRFIALYCSGCCAIISVPEAKNVEQDPAG